MARYEVREISQDEAGFNKPPGKSIAWDTECGEYFESCPTLAEIIEAAVREFPKVSFGEIRVQQSGCDHCRVGVVLFAEPKNGR